MNISQLTIQELSQKLQSRELRSTQVCQHFLDRIQESNPEMNAFITVTADSAMEEAQRCDDALDSGTASLLTGIPIAYKDLFCTKGSKTSCASKMLDNFIAPYDATVVDKMASAGMITIGKTNMDQFAMGSTTENSYYGRCQNPFNPDMVPGGSSGGSAAAVASGMTPAALGTDTGGSIRQPASLCGVTGVKPTYGRISRHGMIAYASSLDQAGPIAKNAGDCALLLNALAGQDDKDSTSAHQPLEDYTRKLDQDIKGIKIGLPTEFFGDGIEQEVRERVTQAIERYQQLGAEIIEVSLPHFPLAVACYYIIAMAEASSNLARFDGVRYGYRCDNPKDLNELYTKSRSEGFSEEVKRRIMLGTYVLSAGYYDAYYLKAQKIRRLIRDDFIKVFSQVDAIIGPVTPYSELKYGEQLENPVTMYLGDLYTVPVNLAGLPALSHPEASNQQQTPLGIQLIGAHWSEAQLLQIAHCYETC